MARILLMLAAFAIGAAAASLLILSFEISLPGTAVVSTRNLDNAYQVQRDAGLRVMESAVNQP